jgi:hypothetical protein
MAIDMAMLPSDQSVRPREQLDRMMRVRAAKRLVVVELLDALDDVIGRERALGSDVQVAVLQRRARDRSSARSPARWRRG